MASSSSDGKQGAQDTNNDGDEIPNIQSDVYQEKGKSKFRPLVSRAKKSVVRILPIDEVASESDRDNKGDISDEDKANDRDVDSSNKDDKTTAARRRLTRKRGRPAKQAFDEMSESTSVPNSKKQNTGIRTESHRRSSRSASESATSKIAAQMKRQKIIVAEDASSHKGSTSTRKTRYEQTKSRKFKSGSNKESSDNSTEFEVERILAKRKRAGITEYRIRWKGFKKSESTWEPAANLTHCTAALRRFESDKSG